MNGYEEATCTSVFVFKCLVKTFKGELVCYLMWHIVWKSAETCHGIPNSNRLIKLSHNNSVAAHISKAYKRNQGEGLTHPSW